MRDIIDRVKQNKHILVIMHYLRFNLVVRFLLKPFMDIKSYIVMIKFSKSEDSKKIKEFKNKHKNERCFIIGNGPSLKVEDLELLKDEVTFGCNRIYEIFNKTQWRPTYYMCMDAMVYSTGVKQNIDKMTNTKKFMRNTLKKHGVKIDKNTYFFIMYYRVITRLEKFKKKNISNDVSKYFSMNFSITQTMIEFALYMGFKEIYLLGIDHNFPVIKDKNGNVISNNIEGHFDGAGSKDASLDMCFYDSSTSCYEAYDKYAKKKNVKIYNASRFTKLNAFEKVNLDSVINTKG